MAPLPCSPVSNSTASEESNRNSLNEEEEDSDDSLTTPRPGPTNPALRTKENLSKPAIPGEGISSSEDSAKSPRSKPRVGFTSIGAGERDSSTGFNTQIFSNTRQTEGRGHSRSPYAYASSPRNAKAGPELLDPRPSSQKSVSFSSSTSLPKPERQGSYSYVSGQHRHSPSASPARMAAPEEVDAGSSSADENTAIVRKSRGPNANYGAAGAEDGTSEEEEDDARLRNGAAHEGTQAVAVSTVKRKKSSVSRGRKSRAQEQQEEEGKDDEPESWWKVLVDKYGSVELENKGSVARDHLALERTFLAWLRTSLSFASIGIAVTQLFRLNTSLQGNKPHSSSLSSPLSPEDSALLPSQQFLDTQDISLADDTHRLRHVGKPLGATFLAISILILLLGFHRYFESQHYVIRGKFPASRGTIVIVTFVASALIVASLVVVLVVAPSTLEK